ncbi:Nucleoside-diphosphate-sugar epimerase [Alteromonadaceae bacterium Bs31]|nr:Nucleoside-diphosphate-sugar epimerase [Alteromonadaceae bacterium Bs31]
MKVLFIGGTGNISTSSSCLALENGFELWHLNRGASGQTLQGVKNIHCNVNDRAAMVQALNEHHWDAVVNWIAFTPADIERDLTLFRGKTAQYLFISSASCYQKPPQSPIITERTPLSNPYWQYSRDKIQCEQRLLEAHRKEGFPCTIVRPSHTYSRVIPIAVAGWTEYTAIDRIKRGLPVVVHGDGTSLWVLTHADDFATGLTSLLGNQQAIGEAYHITSDEVLSWNQIYQHIGQALGVEPHLVHVSSDKISRYNEDYRGTLLGDKSHSVIFDNSKVKAVCPRFQCTTEFADGIRSTLDWFEAAPERQHINENDNKMMDHLIAAEQV